MSSDYIARVQRGARLLDEAAPGWWSKIGSPRDLVMWHPRYNVLGRVFGLHSAGLAALGLDRQGAAWHGFEKSPDDPPAAFDLLAQRWCEQAALRFPAPSRRRPA